MTAELGFTLEFQPLMVPSSVAKMNVAAPDLPFCVTVKPVVELATMPVGLPVPLLAGGTVTTVGTIAPVESYTVETPVTSSEIQKAPPVVKASPHPFFKFGSAVVVTRLVSVN